MLKKVILAVAAASSMGVAMAETYIIREAPPPMREEHVPGPRHGFEWAQGHWEWRHGRYVWMRGHWMREHRGRHWVAERWEQRGDRYVMVPGHWARGPAMGGPGMRDRDHDGVPNRFDEYPNNPYRH